MSVFRETLEVGKMKIVDVTDEPISDVELVSIYRWLDTLEFSRLKKTSANRDFADGVLIAELVAIYIPKIVNTRSYIGASASASKIANWNHLNAHVFKRIRFQLTPALIKEVANAKPGMIERVLKPLRLILLLGTKAVTCQNSKMDNVKSRFMNFTRRPATTTGNPMSDKSMTKPVVQPATTRSTRLPSKSPQRMSPRMNTTSPTKNSTNFPNDRSRYSTPRSGYSSKPSTAPTQVSRSLSSKKENNNFAEKTSANNPALNTEVRSTTRPALNNFLVESDNNAEEDVDQRNCFPKKSTKVTPCSSTWLPVQELDDNDNYDTVENTLEEPKENITKKDDDPDEEPIDEIFCSGYKEDDEYGGFEEDVEDSYEENKSRLLAKKKSGKRKIKRVLKYEYREEYILNGMASYSLPTTGDLQDIQRNYVNAANNDPKCRGYGFV